MKHWVFDLDGTLINSHSVYFRSVQKVLESYGVELTEADKREVLKIAVKNRESFFARKLGADHAQEALSKLDVLLSEDDTNIEVFEGVKELLEKLKQQNYKIGLWTAREMDSAQRVLEHTELAPYFSFCMSGSCVTNCKPSPEGLIRIAKEFDCEPSALSMVGDHDNDMLAARACGARAIRAFWNAPESEPDITLSDFRFSEVSSLTHWLHEV